MSKRPRNEQAISIHALIEQILASKGLDKKLQQYRAWSVWDEVVGPQISQHAQPLRVRESILEVRVENATWMQQLQLLKPKILKELNEKLGDDHLQDIYWKRGKINKEPSPPPPRDSQAKKTGRNIPDDILESLTGIDDPELKKIMTTVLKRDYRER